MSEELKMILKNMQADIAYIRGRLEKVDKFNWTLAGACFAISFIVSLLYNNIGG